MRSYLVALGAFIFILSFSGTQTPKTTLTAHQIIEKMGKAYKNCNSYQDSGIVETAFIYENEKKITQKPFKTYFARPNLFRFEWKGSFYQGEKMFLYVIWCNGKETYTYWQSGKLDKMKSLEQAITANNGVSSGSSYTVPSMLINPEKSFILKSSINETLLGEDIVDGVKCYVIRAIHAKIGKEYELWIGKEDFLLRKLKRENIFPNHKTISEETHKNIRINLNIPTNIFNFNPGQGKIVR